MVFGFGKKNSANNNMVSEPPDYTPPTLGPPTQLVLGMRGQGFTNNQIVQALQKDGYTSDHIFDAMNQADIRTSAQPVQESYPESPYPEPSFQAPMPTLMDSPMQSQSSEEKIEELAEAIIEEKWSDLKENISMIVEWKSKTEAKVSMLEGKMIQLQKSFDDMHTAILGKLGDYDKHVSEIGTDIKAMDQVFQKILPTFTQNVNELSRIVKNTKKIKKP